MALIDRHAKAIEARGLDVELLERYGVKTSDQPGYDIEIPFIAGGVQVNTKFRTVTGEKKFRQEAGARKCFWNQDAITDSTLADLPLIITEGEMDAFAAIQAGFVRTVSVPDGAPAEEVGERESAKYSYLADAKAMLSDIREIILCTDADGPGTNLLADLSVRLGRPRCKWVKYPKKCKDLNDALALYGPRGVTETINRAQWMKVDGVYRMSDLPPVPETRSYEIGMAGLERHYRMRLGDFCVVTGIPSMGKSTFINEICARMVEQYGWNVCFASFEQKPQIDHRRNLRTFFNRKLVIDQHPEEIAAADDWIDRRFSFIVPSEDDEANLPWLLERVAAGILQYDAKIVVIDPWNEIEHVRPADMSLTEYTGFAIRQFRKLAHKYRVHVIVAAHPTKMGRDKSGVVPIPGLYDISDSAHWANKADIGIVIHREESKTLIRVVKSRYHDQIGEPGELEAVFLRDQARYEVMHAAIGVAA